jgi:hypothetical protein
MAAFTEIDDAGSNYGTLLYTGNGSSGNAQTGLGFQPDMVWIKNRNSTSPWGQFDSRRGGSKILISNDPGGELTDVNAVESFDSDGFTVGTDSNYNYNTYTYASWSWKGGTTSGITTDGNTTITPSSYSFNQATGVSIIKYSGNNTTGAKLAHGLGAVPGFAIFKVTDTSEDWSVYHQSIPNIKYMELNTAAAVLTSSDRWNDTTPDSVNFELGDATAVNASQEYIAYCFAQKQGFSKFGAYTGNGDATHGPFIYTGFRPAVVIIKITTHASAWTIKDDKRPGYNTEAQEGIYSLPNTTSAEGSTLGLDFNSNGFKIYDSDSEWNHNGGGFIYAAFAEAPLCNSNGVPGNAH